MRFHGWMIATLLIPSLALGATHSKRRAAAVSIPTPGAFAAASLNTTSDETIGVADAAQPTVDVIGTERSWLHMPTAATTYEPGYSLTASVGSNNPPPDIYAVLLPGTPFEIKFKSVSAQATGTGYIHFDDADLIFGGASHHYTDLTRDVTENIQGATLTVNSTSGGVTCIILVLPGGETYEVAGVRP